MKEMYSVDMIKLYNVIGKDDLEGTVFCRCTTYEKAKIAKTMLEEEGFEDILDIVQDEIPIDVIEIDGKMMAL